MCYSSVRSVFAGDSRAGTRVIRSMVLCTQHGLLVARDLLFSRIRLPFFPIWIGMYVCSARTRNVGVQGFFMTTLRVEVGLLGSGFKV